MLRMSLSSFGLRGMVQQGPEISARHRAHIEQHNAAFRLSSLASGEGIQLQSGRSTILHAASVQHASHMPANCDNPAALKKCKGANMIHPGHKPAVNGVGASPSSGSGTLQQRNSNSVDGHDTSNSSTVHPARSCSCCTFRCLQDTAAHVLHPNHVVQGLLCIK